MQPPEAPAPPRAPPPEVVAVRPAAPAPAAPPPAPPAPPPEGAERALLALLARALLGVIGGALLGYAVVDVAQEPAVGTVQVAQFFSLALAGLALLAAGLVPRRLAALLRAHNLARASGLAAFALVVTALFLVFGLGTAVETARLVEQLQQGSTPAELVQGIDRGTLLFSLAVNFVVFVVPAYAWAAGAEATPRGQGWAWLGLRREGTKWSVAWALVAVLLVFWVLIAAGLLSRLLGFGEVENERAEAIARSLDVPSVLLVALLTGVGEEVFFRGLLLKKLGNAPQAVLFGLAHLNYLNPLEVIVTAALGFGFGRAVRKTGNLWGPVVGHAAFNAVSLLLLLAQDSGWLA